jgi:hypothetical protein
MLARASEAEATVAATDGATAVASVAEGGRRQQQALAPAKKYMATNMKRRFVGSEIKPRGVISPASTTAAARVTMRRCSEEDRERLDDGGRWCPEGGGVGLHGNVLPNAVPPPALACEGGGREDQEVTCTNKAASRRGRRATPVGMRTMAAHIPGSW